MENTIFLTPQPHQVEYSMSHELLFDQHNLDQMIGLLGDESELPIVARFYDEPMNNFGDGELYYSPVEDGVLGFTSGSTSNINAHLDAPLVSGYIEEGFEESHEDGDSSGTATRTTRLGRDRTKTLVSERKRRGRMKEKLYELRSLVPNITKMDKASIIGDAVIYVQRLQRQAKKLMEEVTRLESSSSSPPSSSSSSSSSTKEDHQNYNLQFPIENNPKVSAGAIMDLVGGKILQLTAFEMGDHRFHVKLECNYKGDRSAAVALYTAIESLTFFHLESSNFSTASDSERCVLTFTLKVRSSGEEMNTSNLKLWVMSALLNEGFEFDTMTVL